MSGTGGGAGGRQQQPACGQEALDLLNCVAQTPYDHDKCLRLLNSLRECVLNKVKYLHDFVGRLRVSIAFRRSRARCAPDLAVGLDGVFLFFNFSSPFFFRFVCFVVVTRTCLFDYACVWFGCFGCQKLEI